MPLEIERNKNRFIGIHNGNSLGALPYTMQAILGYGDDSDDLIEFQQAAWKGFELLLQISSLDEILKKRKGEERKYKLPYIESEEYFPNGYTLETLAYTKAWRTKKNIQILADAFNHINKIMKPNHAQPHNKRYSPMNIEYPTPYVDVRLEENEKSGHGLDCDLTFWAVQFKTLLECTE